MASEDERVRLVDVNDLFCDEIECFVVVGNSTIYRDAHHMTATYAETLTPYIEERMRPLDR